MKQTARRFTCRLLAASLVIASPGLFPYEAAAQVIRAQGAGATVGGLGAAGTIQPGAPGWIAPEAIGSLNTDLTPSIAAPSLGGAAALSRVNVARPAVSLPVQLPQAPVSRELAPQSAAPALSAAAAPVQAAPARGSLMQRLSKAVPAKGGLMEALARVPKAQAKIDFDGDGSVRKDAGAVAPAGEDATRAMGVPGLERAAAATADKTAPAVEGSRYYVYETVRDHEIGAVGHNAHYGIKIGLMGSKVALLSKVSALVASFYAAFLVLVPVKLAFFLKLQTTIDQTMLRPWLAKRAPLFGSRREVLLPREELSLIPGVVKTIDASVRHDKSYGFLKGFLGAFLTRRVEEFKVLVMTDRELPSEIRAQDGALLGRMREIRADDNLVFSARSRFGAVATGWKRTVAQVFAGDAVDGATAESLRRELDEHWLRTAVVDLLKLAATTAALGFGTLFALHFLGVEGAKEFAEIVGLTYFIVTGVYKHANGSKVYDRYFGPNKVEGSRWKRLIGFIRDAWKESVGHHENAVSVAQETAAGDVVLGDIARGLGAHAFAGNGLKAQLMPLVPIAFGVAGILVGVFAPFSVWSLAAMLSLAAVAGILPEVMPAPKYGIKARSHKAEDMGWTLLLASGAVLGGLAVAAATAGMLWAAGSLVAALAALAIVIDPFSTSAKSYDASRAATRIPVVGPAFMAAALIAGGAFLWSLPAAAFLTGEAMVAVAAILLISLGSSLKHFIDPGVKMLKTPRSTPALASNAR